MDTQDEDCYLIFGISNNLHVTGMEQTRTKQADIIDALSNLMFAGDIIIFLCDSVTAL